MHFKFYFNLLFSSFELIQFSVIFFVVGIIVYELNG